MSRPDRDERLEAFDRVVSAYEAPLLRYAARILGNRDAAQDVVQNALLRLFRTWADSLEPSPQLSAWLYRVAHNCAVDHMRAESRRTLLHARHAEESPDSLPPNRGREFRLSESAELAGAALLRLNIRERQLVVLKVYEEKSYKEISEITGLTVSNVGFILHGAMKKLAAALRELRRGKELR